MTDPWLVREKSTDQESSQNLTTEPNSNEPSVENSETTTSLQFEDNFLPTHNAEYVSNNSISEHTPLPDSKDYLQSLEKKLQKIKRNPKILEALSEKKAECLRSLVESNIFISKDESLELDAPISSSDSAVQELYRHIQPVQALSVGETVHIVKYDQLEAEPEENEQQAQEDSTSESTSHIMNSPFGEVFLFLTDLAWKSRMTIPVLVTTVFLIMDIRLQIEINIQSGQPAVELADLDNDSVEEYTTDSDDNEDDDTDVDDEDEEREQNIFLDLGRTH